MTSFAQKKAAAERRKNNRARGDARPYPRVRARPVIPGQRSKITRRCLEGRMFLASGDEPAPIANFIGYCLAVAAAEYGMKVHACIAMSNHLHTDVTDPHGMLPAFTQRLHSMIARGLNALNNRKGTFWGGEKVCTTTRPNDDEAFDDLVYTITNPVKHALVKWSCQWPGFTTEGWRFGETRTFERPPWFFDKKGEMPDAVELTLVRPAICRELDDAAFSDKLERAVRQRELELRDKRRRENKKIFGLRRIAQQDWGSVPKSEQDRYKVAPKVSSSCKWLRLAQLQRNREWEREYAAARESLRAGLPALFPFGTYFLKRFAGVQVAGQAPP